MLDSDQPTNAAQVEFLGVGKRLNSTSVQSIVSDVQTAIEKQRKIFLLEIPRFLTLF